MVFTFQEALPHLQLHEVFLPQASPQNTESPGLVSAVGRVNLLLRQKGWPFSWLFLFLVLFWHFIFLHATWTGSYRDSHKSSCCLMSFNSTIFTLVCVKSASTFRGWNGDGRTSLITNSITSKKTKCSSPNSNPAKDLSYSEFIVTIIPEDPQIPHSGFFQHK